MSGPSSAQISLQGEQMQFYQEAMQESQAAFGEQQDLLKQMESVYQPILNRGPNQNAFAGEEQTALDARAIEGTAEAYSSAGRAVAEQVAGQGGDNPLPSGEGTELKEEVATSAAREQATEENQIEQAGYSEGLQEWEQAGSALATASGQLSPASYEGEATGAGNAAESTANQINQEENSWLQPVLGAVGAIGGAAAGDL